MILNDTPFLVMLRDPTIVVLETEDVVFPPSGIDAKVEKSCV